MEGAQNSIEPSWFMHDLMGDGELNWVSIGGDEDDGDERDDMTVGELNVGEEKEELNIDSPGEDHSDVEGHLEEPIIFL